jgi:hypothetical protein
VELTLRLGPFPCVVTVVNDGGPGIASALLNGVALDCSTGLSVPLDRLEGRLDLRTGGRKG